MKTHSPIASFVKTFKVVDIPDTLETEMPDIHAYRLCFSPNGRYLIFEYSRSVGPVTTTSGGARMGLSNGHIVFLDTIKWDIVRDFSHGERFFFTDGEDDDIIVSKQGEISQMDLRSGDAKPWKPSEALAREVAREAGCPSTKSTIGKISRDGRKALIGFLEMSIDQKTIVRDELLLIFESKASPMRIQGVNPAFSLDSSLLTAEMPWLLVNLERGEKIKMTPYPDGPNTISPHSRYLVAVKLENWQVGGRFVFNVWDIHTTQLITTTIPFPFRSTREFPQQPAPAFIDADSIFVYPSGNSIAAWDIPEDRGFSLVKPFDEDVMMVASTSDGSRLAAVEKNGQISILSIH